MPTPVSNATKEKAVPQSSGITAPDNAAIREDWKKLSKADQDAYFQSLPAQDQVDFANRVGLFESKLPVSMSASPPVGSVPWMKEKAYSILNWGENKLPTAFGMAGGAAGALAGGAIDPAGGEIPGKIIGSGIGGAFGEGLRQGVVHLSGADQFEDPRTMGERFKDMAKEGAGQAAAEASGHLLGKWLRPTLDRSLSKMYFAGKLKYGDPLGKGDLETVIDDLIKTEKAGTGRATTVGDFLGVINKAKSDVGQEVDAQMTLPLVQNGRQVMLGHAHADSRPIVNAITSFATADPSIVKLAQMNPAGKEAAYLEHIRREALNFSQAPWTYQELTSRRINLNNELAPLYDLPRGEQRVYLLDHPDLAYKKAEADAIRDIIYPKMDQLSGKPMGTTAELQGKRGALMSLENQVTEHLSDLKTKSRQAQGAPLTQKANISSYGTSSGKPGFAVHRLTSLVHTPNVERQADKKVAQAFGNTVGSKIRQKVTTPLGSKTLGNEILSLPLRKLVNPARPKKPDEGDGGPQSSSTPPPSPKELMERAKGLNPSGQVAYSHVAVNPATGHRIVSNDGVTWLDAQTGARIDNA